MENLCCGCLEGNIKELDYFSFCSHWFCNKCFKDFFKANVLIPCPRCQLNLKISDFYFKHPSKEMPVCMNIDSDCNLDSFSEDLRTLLLNTSGFDYNEIEKSCRAELFEGLP